MTRYMQQGGRGDLYAVSSTGTITKPTYDSVNGFGFAIAPGDFYFPIGGERYGAVVETVMHSFSAIWTAALAGTIKIEGTNCAKSTTGVDQGGPDISDYDSSAAWQLIDITQAGALYAVATGTGNSMAKLTATLGGTNAGGALWNLPDLGMLRLRAHLNATAAGYLRMSANAKLGS